tara:strand:- start:8638 stop:9288 length:651 start_codon:yes stop_codon:yes gene_type:complete
MSGFSIKLEGGFESKFKKNIVEEITRKIKREAPKIKAVVTDDIKQLVRERLIATREYDSIVAGRLRGELGIPESSRRIMAVVDTWVNGIYVETKVGTVPLLSIDIGIIKSDYGDVLSLSEATYTYSSARGGGEIPWLAWLLLEGDRKIVNRYEFTPNIRRGSRTGMGIMKTKKRGFWQVPSDFSGTEVDNFATRAFGNISESIDSIVEKAVTERLS